MPLELTRDFGSTGQQVNSAELSPDEQLLAVASYNAKTVRVYDATSGEQMWSTSVNSFQAVFSPENGTQLAVADYVGNCVDIFASETGTLQRTLSGHTAYVWGVAWSSTRIIASASQDCTVRLWNSVTGKGLRTLSHSSHVFGVSFSPDGKQLASCSHDGAICMYDVASGTCLHTLVGHYQSVWRAAFSPDGSKLASTSRDGAVRVWDPSSNFKCIRSLPGAGRGSWPTMAWTSDSRMLALANGTELRLWDENGVSILQAQNQASAVAISRFAHQIITGSNDGKASCWKSPFTWPLFFDLTSGIPFGKLYLPSQSAHDVSGTLERISTIIDRMDPPVAFHKLIKLLHELNIPSFVDMQARARIARELEQSLPTLIDRRQSLSDTRYSLHQKASNRQPLDEVKEDLDKLESASQFISLMKEYLKEYNQLQDHPPSEDTSFKQQEHSSPRDLPENELDDILSFAHVSHAKLTRLEKDVINTAKSFEKALLNYDQYSAEIREQSEKNIEIIKTFLAYRPSTSISSERIKEIERVISELRVILDNDRDIMNKLDRSLADLSSAKDQLNKSLAEQRSKEQIEMQAALESNARDSQVKGGRWMQMLRGGFRKSSSAGKESTEDIRQPSSPPPPPIEVDDNDDHLRQQVEQAKSNLKSWTAGFEEHAYLVYNWLQEHQDAKLDAGEVFDIIGIR